MTIKEMNKINRRIQDFKDNFEPAKTPNHVKLDTKKRNQAKRQSRKRRDIK